MSDLLLTISLLCCGREKETVRCLDSLKPILEAVPSELILVDTGCSDEFGKKLSEYTDQIIRFQWCNDFSVARNVGVKAARGQWFMTIDDDEWIPDSAELIAFFNEGRYREFTQAYYLVKNYLDRDFIRYTESWAARLFKLGEGVNYKGRIHEYPNALKGEVCYLNMKVHHTGYIYENEAQKMAHAKRNITSLLEALEEFPDNVRYKLQLIQEYYDIREYEKMEEACSSALNYLKGLKKESYELGRIYLSAYHTGLILAQKCLGKTEEALSSFKSALSDDRLIEVGKARIYSLGALLYRKQNDFDKAIECADSFLEIYNKYSENFEYVGRNTVIYSKDAYSVEVLNETVMVKAVCALNGGNYEAARETIGLLDKTNNAGDIYRDMLFTAVDRLMDFPDNQSLVGLIDELSNLSFLSGLFYSKVWDVYKTNKDRFNVLAHALEEVFNDSFVFDFLRLAAAWYDERNKNCEEAIDAISDKHFFLGLEDLCRNNYDEAAVILERMLTGFDMAVHKWRFIDMKLAELLILQKRPDDYQTFEEIAGDIGEYASRVLDFYTLYYTEFAFEGSMDMLPDRARYAGFMSAFLDEMSEGNYRGAFEVLKEMVKAYGMMGEYTRRMKNLYSDYLLKNC